MLVLEHLGAAEADHRAELVARRRAALDGGELAPRALQAPLEPARRAWRPVGLAQLVDDRAVDPRPRELLERRALARVPAVDRADELDEARGDQILDVAAGRQLGRLAVGQELDERRVAHDEPVAQPDVARALVLEPQPAGLVALDPALTGLRVHGQGLRVRSSEGGGRAAPRRDAASIGPGELRVYGTCAHTWTIVQRALRSFGDVLSGWAARGR